MQWFINRKTKTKFLISFGSLVLLLVIVILAAYWIIREIHDKQKMQLEKDFAFSLILEDCRAHMNRQHANILQLLVTTSKDTQDLLFQDIQTRGTTIHDALEKLQNIAQGDQELNPHLNELQTSIETYKKIRDGQVLPLIQEEKLEEAKTLVLGILDESYNKSRNITVELGDSAKEESQKLMELSDQNVMSATRLFVLIAGIAFVLSTILILLLNRIIAGPLGEISKVTEKISEGDTSIRVPYTNRRDEIGTFAQALNQMILILQEKAFYARSLIEASLDPFIIINSEGKITDVNEATMKMTGNSRESLIDTDFSDKFVESDQAREGYLQILEKGFLTDFPLTIRDASAKLTHVLYNASVFKDRQGKVQGIFAAARDITAQKRAEDALRKAHDELEIRVQERTADLTQVLQEIREGITVLSSSASEILSASSQVASGAAETATAVSETTSTVEEVKQTAQVTNQKAKYVAESAQKTVQTSQVGKKAVEDSLDGMNHIREQMESIAEYILQLSEQSQTIGEIIAVVNDIADQSNLLAVNASIEAVKAGEQGKGFSVVAQEVRRLAEQSKQATAQVRTILNNIVKSVNQAVMATEQGSKAVESGMKFAEESGEVIQLLAESVNEAYQAATQIAASNQQQLAGVDQVALAMENINQVSTQNVSSTKQVEIASQNLNNLSLKLKQLSLQYEN